MADTDAVTGAIVPLIGLGIVAGMAGRMMDHDHPRRRERKAPKKYHKQAKSMHWY
jgi:hypothetical protein